MAMTLTVAIVACVLLLTLGFSAAILPGERLAGDVLQYYNPVVRPAHNQSEIVYVRHGFSLITLNVKEEGDHGDKQVSVEANVWNHMRWEDFRLKWNPKEYGGIQSLKLPVSNVWIPDITLFDSFLPIDLKKQDFRVVVKSSGAMSWIPLIKLEKSCFPDVGGSYHCSWKFGSWVYNGDELDLHAIDGNVNLDDYRLNQNWELLNTSCNRNVIMYACCPQPYIDLVYSIIIKKRVEEKEEKWKRHRSGLFGHIIEDGEYGVSSVLLLPTVIVSLLVPFQFLVPPEACQRISVLTILLVALVGLFFVTHAADVSATESFLDLDYFYYVSIVWVFAALLLSIFTLHICRWGHSRSKLPDLLRKIFLVGLGKVVCICYNTKYDVSSANVPMDLMEEKHGTEKGMRMEEQMAALLNVVRGLSNYLMELKENHNEWYLLALVLDRLLCIIFLIIFIIFACIVLI